VQHHRVVDEHVARFHGHLDEIELIYPGGGEVTNVLDCV